MQELIPKKNLGGRPAKYKTPQEFEEKALSILEECKADDGPVPTILWLEVQMGIPCFYDYMHRPRFSDTVTRVKQLVDCLYEQKANKGIIHPRIAAMKLAHERDYAPVVQQVEVKQETTVNTRTFESLFAKAQALDIDSRDVLIKELSSVIDEENGNGEVEGKKEG